MLFKMRLCKNEIDLIEEAINDYSILHDNKQEEAAAILQKMAMLKEYMTIGDKITETIRESTTAIP